MSEPVRRVHPEVQSDLAEAVAYYGQQHPGLGDRIVEEYVQALALVADYPQIGREYLAGYRRIGLAPFPYVLAYAVDENRVYIAAMLHALRDPTVNEAVLRSRS